MKSLLDWLLKLLSHASTSETNKNDQQVTILRYDSNTARKSWNKVEGSPKQHLGSSGWCASNYEHIAQPHEPCWF